MPPKTPRQSGASLPGVATPNLPTYSHGDIVLAKVKGHPAWPARIVDPYASPLNLRDERKIASKNSYLVKFFKTADFAWMNAKEMSILAPPDIRAFINNPNKKGADLKAAYQIALDPAAWEAEIEEFQMAIDEQQKALEIDELEPVDSENADKAVQAKSKQKRKRPSETKTPTMSTKKRKSVDARPPNASAKTSETAESPTAAPTAAPAVKKRGKKKEEPAVPVDGKSVVREWRHRLQRLFLGKAELTEKMMPEIDGVFTDIEEFEMKTEWLTSSKLAKVLKRVGVLEDSKVPLDAKYNIRARARALQEKWRQQLGLGEESHRPSAADGTDEAKANASPGNDDHGKENTDPTATKKEAEEVLTNGKQPPKPLESDDMKMDEDDSLPIKVANDSDEVKKVEATPIADAIITEPPTETVQEATSTQTNGNGNHQATNGEAEATKDEPQVTMSEPEATHAKSGGVNGESAPTTTESEAVDGKPNATNTATNMESETAHREPEAAAAAAVEGEKKELNGHHEPALEETTDQPMADAKPDHVMDVVSEPKIAEEPAAPEPDDDGEQMDCAVTPEPPAVDNIEVDK